MLNNVFPREELSGLARARARDYETKTVNPALSEQLVAEGWVVDRKNTKSVRLRRPKSHGTHLEDRGVDLVLSNAVSFAYRQRRR